jgi:uncharacterized repeat protein (TIGR02543 family)
VYDNKVFAARNAAEWYFPGMARGVKMTHQTKTSLLIILTTMVLLLSGAVSVFSAGSMDNNLQVDDSTGAIQSDDFDECTLATFWTHEPGQPGDPAPTFNGTQMLLTAPAGISHDIWRGGILANRVVQPMEEGDFEVEVKFASKMDSRYQIRGILIEDESGNALRFDIYHNGTQYLFYASSIIEGTPAPFYNVIITGGNPAYMRVAREGDTWIHSYSFDGETWTSKNFDMIFAGNRIGLYSGNATDAAPGEEPEHTAVFDYFYNMADPGSGDSGDALHTLVANKSGEGTILKDPDQESYGCNQVVTLTAVPDPGWKFNGWTGDLQGTANPLALSMNSNKVVTATFVKLPLDYTLTVEKVGNGNVTVEPEQDMYAEGTIVTLTPVADEGWSFSGWSGDATGSETPLEITIDGDKIVTATFGENPSGIVSDDFDTCKLAAPWTHMPGQTGDPAPLFNGTQMILTAPAGSNHAIDASGISVNRVVQPMKAGDFEVEAKFASPMDAETQSRGIIIEDESGNALNFEILYDGTEYQMVGGSVIDGVETIHYSTVISGGDIMYMRVSRAGDTWTQANSLNESTWSEESFNMAFAASNIGPYAGNSSETPESEPKNMVVLDYFYNVAFPGTGDNNTNTTNLLVNTAGMGMVMKNPNLETYGCGQVVTLTAMPEPDWQFNGWSGDLSGSANPLAITMDGDKTITATFGELPPVTYSLVVDIVGSGGVTIVPDQTSYAPDTVVTLRPAADPGWVFSGWSGDASGSDDPLELAMDGHKAITATFVEEKIEEFVFLPDVMAP